MVTLEHKFSSNINMSAAKRFFFLHSCVLVERFTVVSFLGRLACGNPNSVTSPFHLPLELINQITYVFLETSVYVHIHCCGHCAHSYSG